MGTMPVRAMCADDVGLRVEAELLASDMPSVEPVAYHVGNACAGSSFWSLPLSSKSRKLRTVKLLDELRELLRDLG